MHGETNDLSTREQRLQAVLVDFLEASERGREPETQKFVASHPEFAAELTDFLANRSGFDRLAAPLRQLVDAAQLEVAVQRTLGVDGSVEADAMQAGRIRYFGDYELLEEVARGGMGVVFKARQTSLDRTVAVKMILAGQLAGPSDVERFHAEARAAAQLQHPNIVAIHEVGEHHGQHYFSMDYVDGPSLAGLVREAPLEPREASQIVKTVAEAVHFAHERGVIHRDLKPANILLAKSGLVCSKDSGSIHHALLATYQPKITDFGLARRIEEGPGITGTGQVLGTPSYMPPEQASGRQTEVCPASDVYSLGAILYELLVGRPPFRAASPIETLVQVLEDEPAPPRLLNPGIGRDLETIVLKCLSKETQRRYATAAALANDLQAWLDGRPIDARRPNPPERAWRWLRRQRRSVTLATGAAALTGLLIAVALIGRAAWQNWQLGYLSLNTEAVALVADISDVQGRLVVPRVGVPTEDPVALPAGSFRLRVSGRGALSQGFQLLIDRGQRHEFRVTLDHRRQWDGLHIPRTFELIDFGDGADLVLATEQGVRRLDGATSQTEWEVNLSTESPLALAGVCWDWSSPEYSNHTPFDLSPLLVKPAIDVDGDGGRDLVWTLRREAAILALSGKDGKLIWSRRLALINEPQAESAVIGAPAVAHLDGDDVLDLVIACVLVSPTPQRWLEAISGRTGDQIWRRSLDDSWFVPPAGNEVPRDCRWYHGPLSGYGGLGGGTSGIKSARGALNFHRSPGSSIEFHAESEAVPYPPQVLTVHKRPLVAVAAGTRLATFDAKSGEPAWAALDIGTFPQRSPQFVDLDGDDEFEAVVVQASAGSSTGQAAPNTGLSSSVSVWSPESQRQDWQIPIDAAWGAYLDWYEPSADWPLLVDLDVPSDGRQELIVPTGNCRVPSTAGIAAFDAVTGELLWQFSRTNIDDQFNRFAVGLDVDGDGRRDLFAASLAGGDRDGGGPKLSLFVDCLSGRDGQAIWWQRQQLKDSPWKIVGSGLGPLGWWNVGADGWPQLVVSYQPRQSGTRPATYIFSAGSGQIAHVGPDLREPQMADLDGDGALELITFRRTDLQAFDHGGNVTAVHGSQPEFWRSLQTGLVSVADFDRDGVTDRVQSSVFETLASSGRTGELLWKSPVHIGCAAMVDPAACADLDGDGYPDILLANTDSAPWDRGPLAEALSGRTGAHLWSSDVRLAACVAVVLAECRDLDGDGRPEVLVAAAGEWDSSPSGFELRLAVLSGHTGALRWQQSLSVPLSQWDNITWTRGTSSSRYQFDFSHPVGDAKHLRPAMTDLDGDGITDLVVPAVTSLTTGELRAFSGGDGTLLWTRPLAERENGYYLLRNLPVPVAGDLDGDGKAEVIALDYLDSVEVGKQPKPKRCQVFALAGGDGRELWSWVGDVPADSGLVDDDRVRTANRPIPQLIELMTSGDTRRGVCFWNWASSGHVNFHTNANSNGSLPGLQVPADGAVIVLDAKGNELERTTVKQTPKVQGVFRVWCVDLDGDEADELVFATEGMVQALRPGATEPVWTWAFPQGIGEVVSIEPAGRRRPATVVVQATSAQGRGLFGVDGRTGELLWTALGDDSASRVLLASNESHGLLPRVIEEQSDVHGEMQNSVPNPYTACKLAMPAPGKSNESFPTRASITPDDLGDDPRLLLALPWANTPIPTGSIAVTVAMVLVLVVLPVALVVQLMLARKWRFGMKVLLAVPAVIGLAVLVLQRLLPDGLPTASEVLSPLSAFGFGILQGSFLCLLVTWSFARRWRRVRWLLGLHLGLVAVLSGSMLAFDPYRGDPSLRYDLSGWYQILILPAPATSALVLAILLIGALWRCDVHARRPTP